jgi:Mn2+/Fe2+ NRAMP family transporter
MFRFISRLGPGLLYAGAAVGVSHLVQSTRAGADYGWIMAGVVVLANILKYPFFKAGPLFTALNGKSLLDAFHAKGRWAMWLFYLITFTTMFAVLAAVTLITASVIASIFGSQLALWKISASLLIACSAILIFGKYLLLDRIMKMVILLLTITTIATLLVSFGARPENINLNTPFSFTDNTDLFFLIALIGWMPAPLDISIWHSEWSLEANRNREKADLQAEDFDFKVGYWGTTFLAAAFVGLGAMILKDGQEILSDSGAIFAGQLLGMYTATIGEWSFFIIAIAAFTTMFSTTLTVLDAYPRVLEKAFHLQLGKINDTDRTAYFLWLGIVVIGALFVLTFQMENMRQLVDFATTISFLTAPLLASLIYWVGLSGKEKLFTGLDHFLAWTGLLFLYGFSFYYLWLKFA